MAKQNLKNRLEKQVTAWGQIAPQQQFAGYSLEDFQGVVAQIVTVDDELRQLTALAKAATKRRAENRLVAKKASVRILLAMKSHPDHGPDSALVKASGFVTESERRSGLTRKGAGDRAEIKEQTA